MLFMAFRNVRIFLRTLMRFLRIEISEYLSRRSLYLSSLKQINLTRGLYFRVSVPEAEATLISVVGDGFMISLSIDDVKQLFRSIERAFDNRELAKIELGELSWKTDCRVRSNPDKVTISFNRGWERTRIDIRRQDVATAIVNFRTLLDIK